MKVAPPDRDDVDWVLPGWILIWSFVLSATVAALVGSTTSDQLSDEANRLLGLALGGMFAAWSMLCTWSVMIDLPSWDGKHQGSIEAVRGQPIRSRVGMVLIWITNVAVLAFLLRRERELQDSGVFGINFLLAALSVLVPLIVWQWTYRRIHRGIVEEKNRRSIRQILGLTAVMAVLIAALQFGDQAMGVSFAFSATTVISSLLWILMLFTILGRRWWMLFVSIPAVAAQAISISFLVDSQSVNIEAEIMRSSGFVFGFYCCGVLLLALARSSGHRWMG